MKLQCKSEFTSMRMFLLFSLFDPLPISDSKLSNKLAQILNHFSNIIHIDVAEIPINKSRFCPHCSNLSLQQKRVNLNCGSRETKTKINLPIKQILRHRTIDVSTSVKTKKITYRQVLFITTLQNTHKKHFSNTLYSTKPSNATPENLQL